MEHGKDEGILTCLCSLFPQTGGPGGFDLAGLLNNPGFMSMVNHSGGPGALGCSGRICPTRRGELLLLHSLFSSHLLGSVAAGSCCVSLRAWEEPVAPSQASPCAGERLLCVTSLVWGVALCFSALLLSCRSVPARFRLRSVVGRCIWSLLTKWGVVFFLPSLNRHQT